MPSGVQTDDKSPSIALGVSEPLLLSVITGLAYCIIYSFDSGLATFYGVPPQYIHVDVPQLVVLSVLIVVLVGLPISQAMHLDTWDVSAVGSFVGRSIVGILAALITLLSIIYVTDWPLWYIVRLFISSIPISLVIMLAIYVRAFAQMKGSDRRNRWREARRAVSVGLSKPRNVRTTALYFAINVAVVLILGSRALGYYTATTQQEHAVVQKGPFRGYIVVWTIADDMMILQSYRPRIRAFGYDMVETKLEKGESLVWHYVRTGALHNVYSYASRHR